MKKNNLERPYKGMWLDPKSELVFMANADYHSQTRYVREWRLTPKGEEILLGNCRPEVISAYIDTWTLYAENELLLMRRGDSRLIQKYISKYPLSHNAQLYLVQNGKKEDILCLAKSEFPLFDDVINILSAREDGLSEIYLQTPKIRVL